jgi:hypothetical protein
MGAVIAVFVQCSTCQAGHLSEYTHTYATVDFPAAIIRIRRAEHIDKVPHSFGHLGFLGMDRDELMALGMLSVHSVCLHGTIF